tara:strand:+ start:2664 stop:3212 length:549 start_codon:yes stop_codon:yes gene_type:complete
MNQNKYVIGQVVWLGSSEWTATPVVCPDCQGHKTWTVVTEVETFTTYCRTCWHGYDGCYGTVSAYDYRPQVRHLTIGHIEVKQTALTFEVKYMCQETGIGSGSVWCEDSLFSTIEEAQAFGEAQSDIRRGQDAQFASDAHSARCRKDMLVLEDCPRMELQDHVERLEQEIRRLKRKKKKTTT